jgi:NADPH:quinone reductase-like Zn-dependent oxidoreductase
MGDIGLLLTFRESVCLDIVERADQKNRLPFKIGYDLAGTVVAVGNEVTKVKVGDEVFSCLPFKDRGLLSRSPFRQEHEAKVQPDKYGTGSVSEYALVTETLLIPKPKNLNFVEAASIPLVALTGIQMFDKVPGGVEGKTVFIPAGRKCFPRSCHVERSQRSADIVMPRS